MEKLEIGERVIISSPNGEVFEGLVIGVGQFGSGIDYLVFPTKKPKSVSQLQTSMHVLECGIQLVVMVL